MNVATTAELISPISVGSPVPNATLVDMDGKNTTLHDAMQNKAAILIFYRGSW